MKEYAWAVTGMLQVVLDRIGKLRVAPPVRLGGPNAPVNPNPALVSTTRHGVIAVKVALEVAGATLVCATITVVLPVELSKISRVGARQGRPV